jgi:hypothetical protein
MASGDIGRRLCNGPMRTPCQETGDIWILGVGIKDGSGIGRPDWPQDQSCSLESVREHGEILPQISGNRTYCQFQFNGPQPKHPHAVAVASPDPAASGCRARDGTGESRITSAWMRKKIAATTRQVSAP